MSSKEKSRLSYRNAGVNIDAGDNLVNRLKPLVSRTQREGWITGIGGFWWLFELPVERYQAPVLVSGTDGVGTKLKLAIEMDRHDTIGIDLVAMCVNDVIVCGAEPLYFFDYFATSVLSEDLAESVISGIARGCEIAGAALIGGETAEMPGMYHEGHYDLAGFCVGVVEKSKIIDGSKVRAGDHVLGLASSGVHSNGFSLVHAVRERSQVTLADAFGQQTLGESLLAQPGSSQFNQHLLKNIPVKGKAHITGGGLGGNVSRIMPQGLQAQIDSTAWQRPGFLTGSRPPAISKNLKC
ncbi:MAG: phosphoribosylformylglycinamidine cyclo-ligase [Gammaproteobacteria bacterium]|nr:MAG: phosphoribosylformylglycinamidine cyclo-ligase [Gammaproteobacteria bacterium]